MIGLYVNIFSVGALSESRIERAVEFDDEDEDEDE